MTKTAFILFLLPFCFFSQTEEMVWATMGVKGEVTKKIDWGTEFTSRIGNGNVETYFGQASLKYKVNKWFRPSLDYRAISNLDSYSNYQFANRFNLNAEFKHPLKRFSLGLRIRYQVSFTRIKSAPAYNADFDHAVRVKPQIGYNIKGFFLNPQVSLEYFYDPNNGFYGNRFVKYRLFAGFQTDYKGPHNFTFGYLQDQKINLPDRFRKNIFYLSYMYSL
jgi:hypothetical protein